MTRGEAIDDCRKTIRRARKAIEAIPRPTRERKFAIDKAREAELWLVGDADVTAELSDMEASYREHRAMNRQAMETDKVHFANRPKARCNMDGQKKPETTAEKARGYLSQSMS